MLRRSWNIREASDRLATTCAQHKLLSSHEMRLRDLDYTIQRGHAALMSKIGSLEPVAAGSSQPTSSSFAPVRDQHQQLHATQRPSRKLRLKLPPWFTQTVWEFGTYTCGDGWVFQLRLVNIRSRTTPAFAAVRAGNLEVVRTCLALGELSASDCEYSRFGEHRSLLTVSRSCLVGYQISDKKTGCSSSRALRALRFPTTGIPTLPR
jgi:hypothetical protein